VLCDLDAPGRRSCIIRDYWIRPLAGSEALYEAVAMSLVSGIVAYLLAGALVLLGIFIVSYLVLLQVLFYRLRHEHGDHYRELGEPSLFLNNSIATGFRVMRYLLYKDYGVVPDQRVNQLGEYARRLLIINTGLFGFAVFMFAVLAVTAGRFS
jgi:hypothetical protein